MQKDFSFDLFMETSAKTGFNAEELFITAGKILYEEYLKYRKPSLLSGEHLKKKKQKEKKNNCCK